MHMYIHVRLGNEAMQDIFDVSNALAKSASYHNTHHDGLKVGDKGYLHDSNGNCVGSWEVQENKRSKELEEQVKIANEIIDELIEEEQNSK